MEHQHPYRTGSAVTSADNQIVLRRRYRLEVCTNGTHRLHLEYLHGGEEEIFEGKSEDEVFQKLRVYLHNEGGHFVTAPMVDLLDDQC